jgi:hypothetical protein
VVDDCRRALPPPVAVSPGHEARCVRLDAVRAGSATGGAP